MNIDKEIEDNDPDEGLEVREEVALILRKSVLDRISGKIEAITLEEAFENEFSSQ
ncbi:MAG: hypothetical protein UZ05_CHB002001190 [Chlorobi bacterium OLB5]|nr:MAG: hypothetical protein UZ05_CHB002001190 [Chlorobi bacterium OLB5]